MFGDEAAVVHPHNQAVIAAEDAVQVAEVPPVARRGYVLEVAGLDGEHLFHGIDMEGDRAVWAVHLVEARVPLMWWAGHAKLPVQVEHRHDTLADVSKAEHAILRSGDGRDRDHGQDFVDGIDVEPVVRAADAE